MPKIKRLGFFHFVEGHEDPIGRLGDALDEYSSAQLADSLIVLPEVFNLGRPYYPCTPKDSVAIVGCPEKVFTDLENLSRKSNIAFVAGLLEAREGGERPYNSTFLIAADIACSPILLCRKRDAGADFYEPYGGLSVVNPYECGDVCIAALVCSDYARFEEELAPAIATSTARRKLLCIPACICNAFTENRVRSFSGIYVVLANSKSDGTGSFITKATGEKSATFGEVAHNPVNRICCLRTWAELE